MDFGRELTYEDAKAIACIECGAQIGQLCAQPNPGPDPMAPDAVPSTHRIRFSSLVSAMIVEEYLTNAHSVTRA
jgi:hypothetical protein